MPRGGRRPNSGPKKGSQHHATVEKLAQRQKARDIIGPHMPEMIAAQVAHAKGLSYLVYRDKESGKFERVTDVAQVDQSKDAIEVWEKDPSVQAFTDLMNRLLDKPSEHVEMNVSGELDLVTRLQSARAKLAKSRG